MSFSIAYTTVNLSEFMVELIGIQSDIYTNLSIAMMCYCAATFKIHGHEKALTVILFSGLCWWCSILIKSYNLHGQRTTKCMKCIDAFHLLRVDNIVSLSGIAWFCTEQLANNWRSVALKQPSLIVDRIVDSLINDVSEKHLAVT